MKSKKILAALLAVLMALLNLAAALPAFAAGANETGYATPDGYDDHDYQAMVAFLLEENEQGVKNHETLDAMSNFYSYDPADPATWGSVVYEDVQEGYVMFNGVIWTDEPVKRIRGVCWEIEGDFPAGAYPLYGSLDLSDCGALTY